LNETERRTKELIEKTNKNVDNLLEKLNESKNFCSKLNAKVKTFPINVEKNSHLEGSIAQLELVNRSLESSIIEIQNNFKIN
jgi:predicted RNase H-like nuclease (RuvC/YqgF family)